MRGGLQRAPGLPPAEFSWDPVDLEAIRQRLARLPEAARLRPVDMERIVVGPQAHFELAGLVRERSPRRVLLVMDPTPMRRGSDSLKPLVRSLLGSLGAPVDELVLQPDHTGEVHASIEGARQVAAAIRPGTVVVSVGSGTVTDTTKHGCFLADGERAGARRVPFVAVQTANTVTAFTSNMAVLFKDGVKRTLPSRYPDVLVCDLQVLADAPLPMTRAGVGDMMAKFTAYADWYLGSVLGMSPGFSEAPLAMWADMDRLLFPYAPEIGRGTRVGTEVLTKLLLLSGLGMSIVGETAPLSGWEHVISHVLDMAAERAGRRLALHGAQVGVAAIYTAAGWRLFLDEFDPARAPRRLPSADADAMRGRIAEAFDAIDPSGAMAEECWSDYRQKLETWNRQQAAWEAFLDGWHGTIKPRLESLLRRPEEIARALASVGAPLDFDELEPPISLEQARFAFQHAHLIRKRFSLGDLLFFLGWSREPFFERCFEKARLAVSLARKGRGG